MKSFKKHSIEIGIFLSFILPPAGIALLLLCGIQTLNSLWKRGEKIKFSPGLFLLSCLFLSSIGSAFAMHDFSYFLVSALILAYIGLYVKIISQGAQRTFTALKWMTVCAGLYFYMLYPFQEKLLGKSVTSVLTGTALFGPGTPVHYERLIGAAYNPNFSAAILLLGFSFLLAECLACVRSSKWPLTAFWSAIACLFAHAIILTGSKSGFAVMLILLALFAFRLNKMMAILLVGILALNTQVILSWMPRSADLTASAQVRKEIWRNALTLWQEHSLFGLTPIGFHKEYVLQFHEAVPHAHNLVIGMFTEYGALGGTAFLLVVLINLCKLFMLNFASLQNKKQLDVFLIGLPVILLTGMFDYVIYSPQVAVVSIILLALWDKYTSKITWLSPRVREHARSIWWSLGFKTAAKSKNTHS
ncbi:O-antigen ligase family protein [Fictibacillus iocasae]|uniref:O-antigen ligase family protein n=1 Tax=Fictibacillus iocasae TaxID=2715437 RepID=A0ABW2NPJ3_9BACL